MFVVAELKDGEVNVLGTEPQMGMAQRLAEQMAEGAGREGMPVYILQAVKSVVCRRKPELFYEDIKDK